MNREAMKPNSRLLAAIMLSAFVPVPATADLISLQFSNGTPPATSGAAAGDIAGSTGADIWNVISGGNSGTVIGLVNTSGGATPITLDYSAKNLFTNGNFPNGFGGTAGSASPPTELANGFLDTFWNQGALSITLHGFVPNSPVDVTVYAQLDQYINGQHLIKSNSITVNNINKVTGPDGAASPQNYVNTENYENFFNVPDGLLTTAAGDVVITDFYPGGDIFGVATINGLQISGAFVQVPEPASLALLTVVAAGGAGYRWRRKKPALFPG